MANSKDVVVTGVSSGIGLGTTKVLVSKGFRVFGSLRKQADADRLQREFGDDFVPLVMDITDADAVHQAAQKVGSMVGDRNLVGLVNNAGVVVSGPLLYLRPSEYKRQLEVNMISPLVVIQAFAPLLGTDKKRQGPAGRIVNISSSGAKIPIPLIVKHFFKHNAFDEIKSRSALRFDRPESAEVWRQGRKFELYCGLKALF